MKTLALTIAATLIASSSAFAGGLFDVNDAPRINQVENAQFDTEATASVGFDGPIISNDYAPHNNDALFDVSDR